MNSHIIDQWRLAMSAGDEAKVGHLVSLARSLRSENATDLRIGSAIDVQSAL